MNSIYIDENKVFYLSPESDFDDKNFIFNNDSEDVFLFDGKVILKSKGSNTYGNLAYLEVEGIDIFNFDNKGLDYSTSLKLSEITFFLNQINVLGTTSFLHNYRININSLYKELVSLKDLYKVEEFEMFENADVATIKSMFDTINTYKKKLFTILGILFQFNNHL